RRHRIVTGAVVAAVAALEDHRLDRFEGGREALRVAGTGLAGRFAAVARVEVAVVTSLGQLRHAVAAHLRRTRAGRGRVRRDEMLRTVRRRVARAEARAEPRVADPHVHPDLVLRTGGRPAQARARLDRALAGRVVFVGDAAAAGGGVV